MRLITLVKPLLVAGLLLSGTAQASTDARDVLTASPIDDIVGQYPAMMSQGIRDGLKQSGQVPPMVADTIGYVVSSSYRAEDIERKLVASLDESLTSKQLEEVYAWYQTPVAQKISRAEIAASAPSAWSEVRNRAGELNEAYKGTARERLFDRFDRASRATETTVDTTIAVQLGLATAMAALSSDSVHYERLRQRLENQRGMLQGMVGQQVYDSYLYTYRDISVQELGLYLDFLESESGKRFTEVVTESIQASITDPIETIGSQLARFRNFGTGESR
ncbi:DUF2059 domain-containing protein [Marinobacter shengliensis]|uniref:DUF2059 domain-containing protein n=1 Tax=Marinobacter shengliensis TaxID=1389223 RepID=UPI0025729FBA|nr:DUF2059 domain-containing protein [Marinobacter shengliensis]BEH15489.1 hypothetical protein MAALD49_28570 [Marinobacter shengliensis]